MPNFRPALAQQISKGASIAGRERRATEELIILVSEYNTSMATYKDSMEKNWVWENISTRLHMTGKLSRYVEIFGNFSNDGLCLLDVHSQ